MRTVLCILLSLILIYPNIVFSQGSQKVSLIADTKWKFYNEKTKKTEKIALCNSVLFADHAGFFTEVSGCERDNFIQLGRYKYVNDTFYIEPYDFLLEGPFLEIKKEPSTNEYQKIRFFSADMTKIKSIDSSWVIQLFKGRSEKIIDDTDSVLTLKRGEFEGVELLQLSKIYRVPITFWIDKKYDYTVIIDLPGVALDRPINSASPLKGKAIIKNGEVILNNQKDKFKISQFLK